MVSNARASIIGPNCAQTDPPLRVGGVPSRDGGRDELVSAHVAEKHEVEIGAARLTIVRILWRHADHGQKQGPARWTID